MVEGFPIVGCLDKTGVLENRDIGEVVQGAGEKLLLLSAKELRKEISNSVSSMKIDEVSREVYRKTVGTPETEVEKGWASGSFTEEEMTKRNGPLCFCAKRFCVEQGEKVR